MNMHQGKNLLKTFSLSIYLSAANLNSYILSFNSFSKNLKNSKDFSTSTYHINKRRYLNYSSSNICFYDKPGFKMALVILPGMSAKHMGCISHKVLIKEILHNPVSSDIIKSDSQPQGSDNRSILKVGAWWNWRVPWMI